MNLKRLMKAACGLAVVLTVAAANATTIDIYVDTAPNVYGSPDYAAWASAATQAASDGTFVNMAHSVDGANAGSTHFEIDDIVTYSFGDLGRRLTWVYWIPNATAASLAGHIEASLNYVWEGQTYDAFNDYYGSTWIAPSTLTEINGGVVGMAGWAWWGAYGINTQAALDSDLAAWDPVQGDMNFSLRVSDDQQQFTTSSLTATHVPEPATLALVGLGLIAAGVVRRRAKR